MKVITNPNKSIVENIRKKLKENEGYCPCRLTKSDDTKCVCKEFRDMIQNQIEGECHCGLYIATNDKE